MAKSPSEKNLDYFSRVLQLESSDISESGEVSVLCPFHKDTNPSLSLNVRTGLWQCHAGSCGRSGNRETFENLMAHGPGAPRTEISPDLVQSHHEILFRAEGILQYIREDRGLGDETIKKYLLGYDSDRIWIPVFEDDRVVNIRRMITPGDRGKGMEKILNMPGAGTCRIYPLKVLKENKNIILCEGEWDTLLALHHGLPAVTLTAGAASFPLALVQQFKDKKVAIVYDCDEAGRKGAEKAASLLKSVAEAVKIVNLDLPSAGDDLSDWFIKYKKTPTDFSELIGSTELYQASDDGGRREILAEVLDVTLSQSAEGRYAYRRLRMKFHVAGKDTTAYVIPLVIEQTCDMGTKLCARCDLAKNGGKRTTALDETSPDEIIEMVGSTRPAIKKITRRALGIPEQCQKPSLVVTEEGNVEVIRAIPELEFSFESESYVIRSLYSLAYPLSSNNAYEVEAVMLPNPNTQEATALIYRKEQREDSLTSFNVTPEFIKAHGVFQVSK